MNTLLLFFIARKNLGPATFVPVQFVAPSFVHGPLRLEAQTRFVAPVVVTVTTLLVKGGGTSWTVFVKDSPQACLFVYVLLARPQNTL